MATKTRCCLGSDVDLLSRVQLQEVVSMLGQNGTRQSVEFVASDEEFPVPANESPAASPRVATLMNAVLEGAFDALVLDAAFLPARISNGLTIGAITSRITPYDALISSDGSILDELPDDAVVAATTARRQAQMRYYRADTRVVGARGSLDSIIQKVKNGQFDAAVVAAANVERLGRQDDVTELLTNSVCVPGAGQGALAVLVRSGDEPFREAMRRINDATSYSSLRAEWAFLDALGVDNEAPVGVLGLVDANVLELEGILALPDGREKIHFMVKGKIGAEEDLGRTLAGEILDAGGRELLQELHLF